MKYCIALTLFFLLLQNKIDAQKVFKYYDKNFQYEIVRDTAPNIKSKNHKDSLIKEIVITRLRGNKIIQTIKPLGLILSFDKRSSGLQIEDMNFDGYSDLSAYCYDCEKRNTHLCWLYNPVTEIFEENIELSEISSPYFDKKNQKIISTWGGGPKYFGQAIYKVKENKYLLYEYRVDSVFGKKQDSVIIISKQRINDEILSKKQVYTVSAYLKLENHVLAIKY